MQEPCGRLHIAMHRFHRDRCNPTGLERSPCTLQRGQLVPLYIELHYVNSLEVCSVEKLIEPDARDGAAGRALSRMPVKIKCDLTSQVGQRQGHQLNPRLGVQFGVPAESGRS
jgi:hypothetical protein